MIGNRPDVIEVEPGVWHYYSDWGVLQLTDPSQAEAAAQLAMKKYNRGDDMRDPDGVYVPAGTR